MITSGVGQLDFIGPDFLVGGAGHTLVRSFIRVHCVVDRSMDKWMNGTIFVFCFWIYVLLIGIGTKHNFFFFYNLMFFACRAQIEGARC